jgi:hypothetical protein
MGSPADASVEPTVLDETMSVLRHETLCTDDTGQVWRDLKGVPFDLRVAHRVVVSERTAVGA